MWGFELFRRSLRCVLQKSLHLYYILVLNFLKLLVFKEYKQCGGEGGIRTLEGLLTLTPLAGERFQPLSHLSKILFYKVFITYYGQYIKSLSGNSQAFTLFFCHVNLMKEQYRTFHPNSNYLLLNRVCRMPYHPPTIYN